MTPLPLAFNVTDEPARLSFTSRLPLVPACKVRAPVAVSELATVIVPRLAVSVIETVPPVDGAEIVRALEAEMNTFPGVLNARLDTLVVSGCKPLPISEPEVKDRVPGAVTIPASSPLIMAPPLETDRLEPLVILPLMMMSE